MNGMIEAIYIHAFRNGKMEMDNKPASDTYPIVLITIFEEEGKKFAIRTRRLCLRTNLRHYWNYISCKKERIYVRNEWHM